MTITARLESQLRDLRKRFVGSLPVRIAAIAASLRQRQAGPTDGEATLDRQFHNLAGTAGTFGFFSLAAVATDGFDACAPFNGARIEGHARYLWSIVEELINEASDPGVEAAGDSVFHFMNPTFASITQTAA